MKKIAVGVLAGGKSTRMGENKALLQINGKRFLNQICGELGDFSQVIISATRKGDYEDLGLDVVYDEHQDIGPIEGNLSGLIPCTGRVCVYLCCGYAFYYKRAGGIHDRVHQL